MSSNSLVLHSTRNSIEALEEISIVADCLTFRTPGLDLIVRFHWCVGVCGCEREIL